MLKIIVELILLTWVTGKDPGTRQYNSSRLEFKDNGDIDLIVDGDNVRFFAIGDWGGLPIYPYRTFVEQSIAYQMSKWSSLYTTNFQLTLGDNFYFNGVKNVHDKRFLNTFENVFIGKSLETPWFMLLGNHDHIGNTTAQIEYTKYSNKWILPDYNYAINVRTLNGTVHLITILVIDTIQLCGGTHVDKSNRKQPVFKTDNDEHESRIQLDMIENKLKYLASMSIPYLLVAGHYPVWSISSHGPTKCLVEKIRPLLSKYSISAYFCGHDHNLQHIQEMIDNTTVQNFFISGASALNDNSIQHLDSLPNTTLVKFFWGQPKYQVIYGGLTTVIVQPERMLVTFMDSTGKSLYETTVGPRI